MCSFELHHTSIPNWTLIPNFHHGILQVLSPRSPCTPCCRCFCSSRCELIFICPSSQLLILRQAEEVLEEPPVTPNLAVSVSTSFPHAEVFGVKLVNGHATQAVLAFENKEDEPVTVAIVGSTLSSLKELPAGSHPSAGIVRNLTSTRYGVEIPAGEKANLPYTFATEMNPQDLRLQIIAVLQSAEGTVYQLQAYNETVSVVEAATSLFDPQMYVTTQLVLKCQTNSILQHLPLPRPHGWIQWYSLLRLQDMDRDSLPTNTQRWQGWRTRQEVNQRCKESRRCQGSGLGYWSRWRGCHYGSHGPEDV